MIDRFLHEIVSEILKVAVEEARKGFMETSERMSIRDFFMDHQWAEYRGTLGAHWDKVGESCLGNRIKDKLETLGYHVTTFGLIPLSADPQVLLKWS